ncbi:MAG: cation:proton antiporter [Nitriliruptoraceae bacterium]
MACRKGIRLYHAGMAIVGLLAAGAVALPLFLRDRLISYPLVVLTVGALLPLVFPDGSFDPVLRGFAAEHLSEFAVIVALTGLGLSIDRRITWRGWQSSWRLLAITMPLSILATFWLGWWVIGLAPAAAMLLAAALAPTDPVLAVDVQTGPPCTGDPDADEPDEVRFGLTSESSLNDGLAFPFTNLAILMGVVGLDASEWLWDWLLVDVAYKIGGGILFGYVIGKLFGWLTIKLVGGRGVAGMVGDGKGLPPAVLALAYTLVSFGITEVLGAYGFIAVFVTAYVVRDTERANHVHDRLHEGAEQLELLAMSLVVLLLGAAFTETLAAAVTVDMVVLALVLVLLVRPLTGWIGLIGYDRALPAERAMTAFFGIRGLGSIYYLAYGLNRMEVADARGLWALTGVIIVTSLLIHGLSARPAMRWLERHRDLRVDAADRPPRSG